MIMYWMSGQIGIMIIGKHCTTYVRWVGLSFNKIEMRGCWPKSLKFEILISSTDETNLIKLEIQ